MQKPLDWAGRPDAPAPEDSPRQVRHTCSPQTDVVYGGPAPRINPRRTAYPNLSPTRPSVVAADARLWPAWTDRDRWGPTPEAASIEARLAAQGGAA